MSTMTFARPRASVWGAYASLFGGIGLFAMIFVLLAIRLATERPEQDSSGAVGGMGAAIGLPAVFLILAGIRGLRGPRRVRLEDGRLAIDWPLREQRIAWRDLAGATARTRATTMGQDERVLHLVGHDGRDLAVLPATLERFDVLADEITTRLAGVDRDAGWPDPAAMEAGVDAVDAAEAKGGRFKAARDVADDRRSRRRGMIAAAGIVLMFGAGTAWGAYETWKNHRFATADGATAEARVERAWMLRQTPWIRYAFTDEHGTPFARETSAKQDAWLMAQLSPTVTVEYLRSDPARNRLKTGEQAEPFGPGLLAGCAAFCLFGVAMLAFLGSGLDFKVGEGEPGGRLTRHGRAIWRSTANAAFAAAGGGGASPAPAPPIRSSAQPSRSSPPAADRSADDAAPSAVPSGIVALGRLAIGFGAIGVLWHGAILAWLATSPGGLEAGQGVTIEPDALTVVWHVGDALLAIGLIACGIGLIGGRRWAVIDGLAVGVLQILSSAAVAWRAVATWRSIEPEVRDGPHGTALIAGVGVALLATLLSAIFPIVLVAILGRPSVRERVASIRK